MNHTETTLEFNRIKEMLADIALSDGAKDTLAGLTPLMNEDECRRRMAETTAAKKIVEAQGTPPLTAMKDIGKNMTLIEAGAMPTPEQLGAVQGFLGSCSRMKGYLKKAELTDNPIALYGASFDDLPELRDEIDRCIRNEQVDSDASPALRDLRRKKEKATAQVQAQLSGLLRSKAKYLSDSVVVTRNGRYALPVKREHKNEISGSVIDMSGSGATVFIEPSSVQKLQSEVSALEIEEENEVRTVLYQLGALVDSHARTISVNMECMQVLDVLFAKAKLSVQMKANPVEISTERYLDLRQGRHPLISRESCVPLDFKMGRKTPGVIITGPNTGGKTVALKTVGLLSMMAQAGLHVPADGDSVLCMHSQYLCDIGDGQSILENLSTFSAHMTNIIDILRLVDGDSLVLLDELGSGTDPAEGMGIAVAVLEELRQRGCLFLVTTHYPEIKTYAEETPGLTNARMAFDRETLAPTYRLELGVAGESCALYIARRLGLPEHLLERAEREAYRTGNAPGEAGTIFSAAEREAVAVTPKLERTEAGADTKPGQPGVNGVVSPAPVPNPSSRLQRSQPKKVEPDVPKFQLGDSVMVLPEKETGIVFRPTGDSGDVGVQIKGQKQYVSHKRVQLLASAQELYPPDYDFSVIFDTVETRKARKKMTKRHQAGLEIAVDEDDWRQ